MNDVLALVERARVRTITLNDELAAKHSMSGAEAPIGGLNMANQYAVLSLELLRFYDHIWSRISDAAVKEPDRVKQENGERVKVITKAALILTLSAFEYSAKAAVSNRPTKITITPKGKWLHLSHIIAASKTQGIISPADEHVWEGVLELRNALVHNNGIADRSATYQLPGGPSITFSQGQHTMGDLRLFPESTLWSIEAFGHWCDGFLS